MRWYMRWLLAAIFSLAAGAGQTVAGRYIVELEAEPAIATAGKDFSAAALRDRAAQVRANQEFVRQALAARNLTVKAAVDTVANALIVEAPDASALSAVPGVRAVYPVREYQLKLDRVIALMKFPQAWAQAGGPEQAGAGMKIAIIDTGIDHHHIAFQDPSARMPEGFPKFSPPINETLTNSKIIVARSYDNASALDRNGHGTGVAMMAAGVPHRGPRGDVSGIAPRAWLGNYRVSEGAGDRILTDNVLRAIDDAVKDGMDVINLSFGGPGITSATEEIINRAVARAFQAGVLVVTAAGNEGPDMATISDIGSSEEAISVGSSENDRQPTTPAVIVPPGTRFFASLASNSENLDPIQGALFDVEKVDASSLACDPLPRDSLKGKIALIRRGECFFEVKFNNAQAAGAVAAVIYNNEPAGRVGMAVGEAKLPGMMVSRADGFELKDRIALQGELTVVLFFQTSLPMDPNQISEFSSRGPTADLTIKPDVVAIGGNVITATNGTQPGDPESSAYVVTDGTSISSPIVAGAAAVLRAARRGLTALQYRSLLINTASLFPAGSKLDVMNSGVGLLDLASALAATHAASPASISFGELRGQARPREITLSNLSTVGETLRLAVVSNDSHKPALSTDSVVLGPGAESKVTLSWPSAQTPPGAYQGFIEISNSGGVSIRVPYWMAVRSTEPKQISLTYFPRSGAPGTTVDILFRVVDGAGLSLLEPAPEVTAEAGSAQVLQVRLLGDGYPGVYQARVRLGPQPGTNEFKIVVSGIERRVRIRAVN